MYGPGKMCINVYSKDFTTSFPASSLMWGETLVGAGHIACPGISRAKLKYGLGRGSRGVCLLHLENCNLCVIVSGDKNVICNKKS